MYITLNTPWHVLPCCQKGQVGLWGLPFVPDLKIARFTFLCR